MQGYKKQISFPQPVGWFVVLKYLNNCAHLSECVRTTRTKNSHAVQLHYFICLNLLFWVVLCNGYCFDVSSEVVVSRLIWIYIYC